MASNDDPINEFTLQELGYTKKNETVFVSKNMKRPEVRYRNPNYYVVVRYNPEKEAIVKTVCELEKILSEMYC